jgi:hypothetical protein
MSNTKSSSISIVFPCFTFDVGSGQGLNIYPGDTTFVMILLYQLLSSHLYYTVQDYT